MLFLESLMQWQQGNLISSFPELTNRSTFCSFDELDRKLGSDGSGADAGEAEEEDNEFDD